MKKNLIINAHHHATVYALILCIYIVHVQGVDQKYFGHVIKLHTFLLYIDSIFTIQDFTSLKTD